MPTAHSSSSNSTTLTKNKLVKETTKSESSETYTDNQHQDKQAGNKTPQEQPEFIKQALIIIEKKVRNLDKRRLKLEEYKDDEKKGKKLNEDQLSAVSKYDEVIRSLELSRELEKQFVGLANDAMKQQKKQAKKEQIEREEAIKEKLKENQKLISILDKFGDETVRNDFLNEQHGAIKLTEEQLNILDEFDKLVQPCELGNKLDTSSSEVADHLLALIESKNKPITQLNQSLPNTNLTYFELRKLFDRISLSPYWTREPTTIKTIELETEQNLNQPIQETSTNNQLKEVTEQHITETHYKQEISLPEHQQEEQTRHIEQIVYHQQNTSDDFVIVEYNEQNNQKLQQSPLNQQQQQAKTFFTTLNPADLSTQFLNRNSETNDDGINFLQDSEIQLRQQEHHHQSDNFQTQTSNQQTNYNQEFNQNENQKDNNFTNKHQKGSYNGNRNYGQRPRYPDDRRSGGGMPRHNNTGQNNQTSSYNNYNNNTNNNNRNMNGGASGGYRTGGNNRSDNRTGGNNSGGGGGSNYYRGQNNNNNNSSSGRSGGSGGGPRNSGYRNQQDISNHQQPIVQN